MAKPLRVTLEFETREQFSQFMLEYVSKTPLTIQMVNGAERQTASELADEARESTRFIPRPSLLTRGITTPTGVKVLKVTAAKEFGRKVREWRTEHELTQAQVCAKLKGVVSTPRGQVTAPWLSNVELAKIRITSTQANAIWNKLFNTNFC